MQLRLAHHVACSRSRRQQALPPPCMIALACACTTYACTLAHVRSLSSLGDAMWPLGVLIVLVIGMLLWAMLEPAWSTPIIGQVACIAIGIGIADGIGDGIA